LYLGANGLNLTEAQHVILVEPQLHRSVELQAIARVRRLGQKYNTYVYRVYLTNKLFEEKNSFKIFIIFSLLLIIQQKKLYLQILEQHKQYQ